MAPKTKSAVLRLCAAKSPVLREIDYYCGILKEKNDDGREGYKRTKLGCGSIVTAKSSLNHS